MTKITWAGLTDLEKQLVVRAEIYAQITVEYVDTEELDAAENLRGEGLLYTYDTTARVKIFEITDDGREVYKQGAAHNPASELAPQEPAQPETAADGGEPNTFQRAVRAMGTNEELAVALYQAHTFEGVANDTMRERDDAEAELQAAKQRIAALEAALALFADEYHNWLADEREETYLQYLDRMHDSDNMAVSAAMAYKLLQAAQDA